MGAPVAYFEIIGPNAERQKAFFAELFGWEITDTPGMGDYGSIDLKAAPVPFGGGLGSPMAGQSSGVYLYFQVEDLQATLDKAVSLGGAVVVEPTDLPNDWGAYALFADLDGHTLGLWREPA